MEINRLIRDITSIVDGYVQFRIYPDSYLCHDLGIRPTELSVICKTINEKFGTSLDARRGSDESIEYCRTVKTLAYRVFEELTQRKSCKETNI